MRSSSCIWLVAALICVGLGSFHASLGAAQQACPSIDGRWRAARIEEAAVFVITSDHNAVEVRWDGWNIPGPLRLTRTADGCAYTGSFRNQRWLLTDPDGVRVLETYTGTATLRVDDGPLLHLEITGLSRDEHEPRWSGTRFHITSELSRS